MDIKLDILRIKFFTVLALTCVAAAGCLPRAIPAPAVYTLSAETRSSTGKLRKKPGLDAPVMKLMPVYGPGPFVSTDILYRNMRHGLNSYALSRWSNAPTKMIETFLLKSLNRDGLFRAVLPPASSSTADLLLEGILYDFSLHLNPHGAPAGVIKIQFYLIKNDTQQLIAAREFSVAVSASDAHAANAVEAINRAVQETGRELAAWLSSEISNLHNE